MAANREEDPESGHSFRLGTFLEENYKLFTALSVFGAISVYFPRLGNVTSNNLLKVGFVSALVLFILTAYAIDRRFLGGLTSDSPIITIIVDPSPDSYEAVLFAIPFNALVLSIIGITGVYGSTVAYLFQFIGIIVGVTISFHTLHVLIDWLEGTKFKKFIRSRSLTIKMAWSYIIGGTLVYASFTLIRRVQQSTGFSTSELFIIGRGIGLPAVADSVLLGVGFVGGIYMVAAGFLTIGWVAEALHFAVAVVKWGFLSVVRGD